MILITAVLFAGIGAYLKYDLMAPFGLYEDEAVIKVPFLLLSDEAAQEDVMLALNPIEPPVEVPTELPTETPTEEATEPQTEPVTEAPTEVPTEAATEPPTEPIVIDESWFDDALFIGDSRIRSMSALEPLGKAHYFCDYGLSVFDVRYKKCYSKDFYSTRLDGLLTQFTYGKIYIVLGINGMQMPQDETIVEYQKLIDLIRELQPDAAIILHSIMTVGRDKATYGKYYSLENIYSLNEKIAELASENDIFYIDINEVIADEEGYLPDELSKDGVHLYGNKYPIWSQWLMDTAATFGIR